MPVIIKSLWNSHFDIGASFKSHFTSITMKASSMYKVTLISFPYPLLFHVIFQRDFKTTSAKCSNWSQIMLNSKDCKVSTLKKVLHCKKVYKIYLHLERNACKVSTNAQYRNSDKYLQTWHKGIFRKVSSFGKNR